MKRDAPLSGRFTIVSTDQWRRIFNIGRAASAHPEFFRRLMAPAEEGYKDTDGNEYFGSRRHVVETAIALLETTIMKELKK